MTAFDNRRALAYRLGFWGALFLLLGISIFVAAAPCPSGELCLIVLEVPFAAWLVPILLGAALVGLGAWIKPRFWWGRARFTTPYKDPSHEYKISRGPPR